MSTHEKYIMRCIQLAKNGLGTAAPNPLVGSVIVYNEKIIGEGWHYQAGEAHAEVQAIKSIKDTSLLKDATIYVSLEPCSHYGKTPPCSDLIIKKGIKKVVVGTIDPFSKVSGNGIKKLMEAGCDVVVGVLEKECQELNKRFFTYHTKKRPYIILKWAQTFDGFIAPETMPKREPVWITNTYTGQLVHKWRAEEDAILVGNQTVLKDNPKLTIRNWIGKNPVRVVIDRSGITPVDSAVLDKTTKTIIITSASSCKKNSENLVYEVLDPDKNIISEICSILYKQNIQSVIIEGGAKILNSFIENNTWDEARVLSGNNSFGSGVIAPKLTKTAKSTKNIQEDILRVYYND